MMESKPSQAGRLPDFVKYESIGAFLKAGEVSSLASRNLEVFEKMDGGNCQVRNYETQLIRGSRAHFIQGKSHSRHKEWFNDFTAWVYSNHSLYNLPEHVIPFGEWAGNQHVIQYDEGNKGFFDIDVLNLEDGRFMRYEDGRILLENSGVEGIRFLEPLASGRVTPRIIQHFLYDEPSAYYDGPKEGLVIKDYDNQEFFKILHPNFAEKVVLRDGQVDYLTDARFRKAFFDLSEGGGEISSDGLVEGVIDNIKREENWNVSPADVKSRLELAFSEGRLKDIASYLYGNRK